MASCGSGRQASTVVRPTARAAGPSAGSQRAASPSPSRERKRTISPPSPSSAGPSSTSPGHRSWRGEQSIAAAPGERPQRDGRGHRGECGDAAGSEAADHGGATGAGASRVPRRLAGQEREDDPAPGLHPVDHRGDLWWLGERTRQLVGLADRHRATGGIGDVHRPEMNGADLGRIVVEERDQLELRHEFGHEFFGPLAPQPTEQAAVTGVEVPTDADRVPAVQPGIAAGRGPTHQEEALAVAQDEVRDDLLERGIPFHGAAWLVAAVTLHGFHERL